MGFQGQVAILKGNFEWHHSPSGHTTYLSRPPKYMNSSQSHRGLLAAPRIAAPVKLLLLCRVCLPLVLCILMLVFLDSRFENLSEAVKGLQTLRSTLVSGTKHI